MKKVFLFSILLLLSQLLIAQQYISNCEKYTVFDVNSTPDLGIVIYTDDAETVWNAIRLATYAQSQKDIVVIFLLGKGLDGFQSDDKKFPLENLKDTFAGNGGQIIACGSCAKIRDTEEISMCTISSLADFYQIIKQSKKVVSF
jgi:uncharacterized protein involved in oxidation of intracellular sulfur